MECYPQNKLHKIHLKQKHEICLICNEKIFTHTKVTHAIPTSTECFSNKRSKNPCVHPSC